MGSLSDYAETEMLDHILGQAARSYATPGSLWVALSTEEIDDATDGGSIIEPIAMAYVRKQHDGWDEAASRVTENVGVITFAESTGDWGTIGWWAITDAVTAGEVIAWGAFDTPKAVGDGDNASVAAGAIEISVATGGMSTYLANKMLDHFFKQTTYTAPTSLYVGLSTVSINDATTGGTVVEPADEAYGRQQQDAWETAHTQNGTTANSGAITFTQATQSWNTIIDFFVADSEENGQILFYEDVDASKAVGENDTVQIDATDFGISLA